jgi:hypothetical protein
MVRIYCQSATTKSAKDRAITGPSRVHVTLTLTVTLCFGSGHVYQKNGYAYLAAGETFGYALPISKR